MFMYLSACDTRFGSMERSKQVFFVLTSQERNAVSHTVFTNNPYNDYQIQRQFMVGKHKFEQRRS